MNDIGTKQRFPQLDGAGPRPAPATVHVVDDDQAIRDSLALLLGLHGYDVRGYASGEAFLDAVDGAAPGCALIDLRLPGLSGSAIQEALRERGVNLPVVVITAYGDVAATRAAFKAGAVDFIEKPIDDAQLLAAVRAALDRNGSTRDAAMPADESGDLLGRLTDRERQVLDAVLAGRHNREIGAALGISPRTVEVYKSRMMEKLRVRRVPDLVRLVGGNARAADAST